MNNIEYCDIKIGGDRVFCLLAFLDAVTSLPIGLYGIIVGVVNTPNEDEEVDDCNHDLLLNLLIALGFLDLVGLNII